jgi:hypothetical protein
MPRLSFPASHIETGEQAAGAMPYSLLSGLLSQSDEAKILQWKNFQDRHSPDDPMLDPDWLRGYFASQTDALRFYSLHQGDRMCGLVPFLRRDWSMPWHVGAWKVADFPLSRLRLLGSMPTFPEDETAYDLLFRELAKPNQGYDTVFLEDVPLDSYLWKYLQESPLIRRSFLPYAPDAPSRRLLLRFDGTFEQYMGKFSSKHRKNLQREVRKLREGALGEMRLVRFEAPEEVPGFLDAAFELSKRTYQWALYQRGLSATELIRERAGFAADNGWFRSYLLYCGERTGAFILGFQYRGRFLLHEIGFDPELAKHSVGTVSLLLMIEDLFQFNPPTVLDFESYGKYKEALSTESYLQGKLYLFRRGAYSRFLRAGHRSCSTVNQYATTVVDRLNLRTKFRRKLRGWNGPGDVGAVQGEGGTGKK